MTCRKHIILFHSSGIRSRAWLTATLFRSDADSDVLADYVLALIRAETPEPELRLSAIENLEDFLKDSKLIHNLAATA